jgi:hypothetical protein
MRSGWPARGARPGDAAGTKHSRSPTAMTRATGSGGTGGLGFVVKVRVARPSPFTNKFFAGVEANNARDEVEVAQSVAAAQAFGHGESTKSPALEKASRTGHPSSES